MRTPAAVLIGALLVVFAGSTIARAETVTGQLIDLSCYSLNKKHTGNNHEGRGMICAQGCAREGFAVGLLTGDEKVYQVTGALTANTNAKLVPHMGHTVTLTGDVSDKDGKTMIAATDLKMAPKAGN